MVLYELRFLHALHDIFSCPFMDNIMVFISTIGNGGLVWIVFCIILLIFPKTRKAGAAVAISLLAEAVSCFVIKGFIARPRPFMIDMTMELLIPPPADFSFPSGHTGSSFAVAAALYGADRRLYLPALILAALIGFSRMYLFVHYPSDIVAGIILGMISGWAGRFSVSLLSRRHQK